MNTEAPEDAPAQIEKEGERSPSFTEDFICISEFSEIVGPVPLFCIPDKAVGSFNLEKFVIRIMAVDYQNKVQDTGSFMEDTQVVISETSEDAYAYVHHFTIMDVLARGYVRPFCVSYITRHPTKIMENFADMLEKFIKISEAFKKGNQLVFLSDIEKRMADLHHTKQMLEKEGYPHPEIAPQQQQQTDVGHSTNPELPAYLLPATQLTGDSSATTPQSTQPIATNPNPTASSPLVTKNEDQQHTQQQPQEEGTNTTTPSTATSNPPASPYLGPDLGAPTLPPILMEGATTAAVDISSPFMPATSLIPPTVR